MRVAGLVMDETSEAKSGPGGTKPEPAKPEGKGLGSTVEGTLTPAETGSASASDPGKKRSTTGGSKHDKKSPSKRSSKFAPQDLTDGREPLDWATKYPDPTAQKAIAFEKRYVGFLLILIPLCTILVWLRALEFVFGCLPGWAEHSQRINYSVLAWLGGALGGTLFSTKWLYHSVAKQVWHIDRRLWRIFTPPLSGSLAFITFLMISSGMLPIIERKTLDSEVIALSVGFIVGYFSDSATAKLTEVAETLFGSNRK
jgi:hypothetical protein